MSGVLRGQRRPGRPEGHARHANPTRPTTARLRTAFAVTLIAVIAGWPHLVPALWWVWDWAAMLAIAGMFFAAAFVTGR